MDGFEGYEDADGAHARLEVGRRYTVGADSLRTKNGRFGGWCIVPAEITSWFKTPSLTTDDTLIVGFALKFVQVPNDAYFFWMYSDGSHGMGLGVDDSGVLCVYRDYVVIAATTEIVIRTNKWHYVEFKVVCDSVNGSYELRVNGQTVLSDTGIDTQVNEPYHDQVFIRGTYIDTTKTPWIDDYYICDSTGTKQNDFIGQQRILPIFPNADTTDIDWTPSAVVDHYTLVDEVDPEGDGEYVEDTVTDNEDIYGYENIAELDNEIAAVCLCTDVCVTDGTPYDLKTVVKSGGVKYDSAADTIDSTDYVTDLRLMADDPNTAVAWIQSGVNSVEMGIKVG